tara:strand:+ start:318 stop:1085 length:768 start_codon:yes stop_codon:yes gene_type:complete
MAGEFIPGSGGKDCGDYATWGTPSEGYHYIFKGNAKEEDYPDEACTPWYHKTAQIDGLRINNPGITGDGNIDISGDVTATTFYGNFVGSLSGTASGNKGFDIPHVKDSGKRIRHICVEGPESGIYVRGKLKDSNQIVLPEYWDGLVDPETITVTLTQIGYSQDLIVEDIEWGKIVKIKSGNGANINCYYEIWAARHINPMDHSEKLHVVYDGDSPKDYPGNNEYYLLGGWDYDRRETKWRRPEEEIDSVNLDKDP